MPVSRCGWATSEPELTYHDTEWGVPVHDDRQLFEMLTLEGAQAGLSWRTVLLKRDGYRKRFLNFDIHAVAAFTPDQVENALLDPGIIRNRLKVLSVVKNAQAIIAIQSEFGSFDAFLWSFVDGSAIVGGWKSLSELPSKTPLSDKMSRELLARGFKFVGSTICYAFMQATGMANDHIEACFRRNEV